MRPTLLLLLLLASACLGAKSYYTVTDRTQISLITVSPGSDTYATFGHTGIRVRDPLGGFDLVFNYGAFDFNEPGFYRHFISGQLNYAVVIEETSHFIDSYREEKRLVVETPLYLDAAQKQRILTI